jgi:hypothetical protein
MCNCEVISCQGCTCGCGHICKVQRKVRRSICGVIKDASNLSIKCHKSQTQNTKELTKELTKEIPMSEVKGHWDIGNLVGEWKLCVDFSHLPGRNCDEIGETPHHRFVPDASEVAETITRNVGETPLHARDVGETPSTTKRDSIMEEWIKFGWDESTAIIANQREQLTGMNEMIKRLNEQIKIDRWHIDSLDRIILARNAKLADLESAKKEPLATSAGLIAELEKRIAKYKNSISNNLDKRYWMGVVAAFNDMLDLAKRHALIDEKAGREG